MLKFLLFIWGCAVVVDIFRASIYYNSKVLLLCSILISLIVILIFPLWPYRKSNEETNDDGGTE